MTMMMIVGTQNLAPRELTSELYNNSLHKLNINKKQGTLYNGKHKQ